MILILTVWTIRGKTPKFIWTIRGEKKSIDFQVYELLGMNYYSQFRKNNGTGLINTLESLILWLLKSTNTVLPFMMVLEYDEVQYESLVNIIELPQTLLSLQMQTMILPL